MKNRIFNKKVQKENKSTVKMQKKLEQNNSTFNAKKDIQQTVPWGTDRYECPDCD